jgi:arylsulfatase A-like enzyme
LSKHPRKARSASKGGSFNPCWRALRGCFDRIIPLFAALLFPQIAAAKPNVLIVMTDDQGFGDLGAHGNPQIRTPNLDAFTKQSVWLKNFYVSPVCSPTRSSLLTGQYHYRTGIVDTYLGRSLMRPDVKTLPEMLAAAGYRTGLFGKWHLGDNYPLRPEDRGFQETLWSQGGGLAQPSDSPALDPKTAYFNPILKKNGKEIKTSGYCTDVFTDAALEFMSKDSEKPFFAYVAYNAPHGPLQVEEKLVEPFKKLDLGPNGFPKIGQPWAGAKIDTNATARLYAMIENIDSNFGRMMKLLDEKRLSNDTLVIFLTDNGPDSARFNAGLRNRKGTVYEGGIRVPCYVRWPARIKDRAEVSIPLAHIDVTPTVLEAVEAKPVEDADGMSFLTNLLPSFPGSGEGRRLFFQWHRGDVPEKYRAFAVRTGSFKLVQAQGSWDSTKWQPRYELFDLRSDPFEEKDLSEEKPKTVADLKQQYEIWFDRVTKKGFDPPRIVLGNAKENPVRLSRQDWRGPKAGWATDSLGHWETKVERAGKYRVTLISHSDFGPCKVLVGDREVSDSATTPRRRHTFELTLPAGDLRLSGIVQSGEKSRGVDYLEVESLLP